MEFFGVGKQQEVSSIVAAVKAANAVGRGGMVHRRPMAFVVADDDEL